ncbi:holin [Plantactinospora solaniradicis]|uniref:Holin n=1 Tax=Plantactinospora solaniradicis TaxID=1723736 RepID=A0ABW1K8K7_9ACTN
MFTSTFWKQAVERAVKTFAQSGVALLTGDGLGLVNVDWGTTASVAGLAALVSLLTSVATSSIGEPNSPSAVAVETEPSYPR